MCLWVRPCHIQALVASQFIGITVKSKEVLDDLDARLDQTGFRFSPPHAVRKDLCCFFLKKKAIWGAT